MTKSSAKCLVKECTGHPTAAGASYRQRLRSGRPPKLGLMWPDEEGDAGGATQAHGAGERPGAGSGAEGESQMAAVRTDFSPSFGADSDP